MSPRVDYRPIFQSVNCTDADAQLARELLRALVPLARAASVKQVPDQAAKLARDAKLVSLVQGANHLIHTGHAANGAQVIDLAVASGYKRDKNIRPAFHPSLRLLSQVGVRLLMAQFADVIVEHYLSRAVIVRRETNLLGLEHATSCTSVKPLVQLEVGGLDRQLEAWQLPYLFDTLADPSRADADPAAIARAADAFRCDVPDSEAGWLELALTERQETWEAIDGLIATRPELVAASGISPRTALDRAFAGLLAIESLPHGFPQVPGESCRDTSFPGRDDAIVAVAERFGMAGIACCGEVVDASELRGETSVGLELDTVTQFAVVQANAEFSVHGEHLFHTITSRKGSRTRMWRVFGMDADDQRALALAQRTSQPFLQGCRQRAERQRPAGRVYPKTPKNRLGMRDMLRLADAARVCAEKARRSRRS